MSVTFGHGRGGGALLSGRDLTRYSTDFNYGVDLDQAEQTCLQAPGGSKEFLYGNTGASAGIDGRLAKSRADVERELATTYGKEDDSRLFALAPFGFEPGNWAIQFLTRKQTYRLTGGITSVVGTGGTFQADSATRVGRMLQAPRVQGGVSVQRNEIDVLVWNGADPNQFFALRNTQTATKSADFRLTTYIAGGVVNAATLCAFVKAQVETLYPGRVATVTVTNPFALSSGLWSGTVQISFDGTTNLAPLDVVSGAVRRRLVANGDTGTYSFDGSTPRVLPISQATFDADQKAIDAAHAGSVSIGTSAVAATTNQSSGGAAAAIGLVTDSAVATLFDGVPNDGSVCGLIETSKVSYTFAAGVTRSINQWGFRQENSFSTNNYVTAAKLYAIDNAGVRTLLDTRTGIASNLATDQLFNIAATSPARGYEVEIVTTFLGGPGSLVGVKEIYFLLVNGATLDFNTYFPTAAAPGALSKIGTGSTNTALVLAGSVATTLIGATAQEGGTFNGLNLLSGATTGLAIKTAAAPHQNGATLDLHATFSIGTLVVPVLVEHAPDVSGAPGAWATLGTFAPISDASDRTQTAQRIVVAAGTTVNPWKRFRLPTLTGQIALAVIAADRES